MNFDCATYDSGTGQYKGFWYDTNITVDMVEGAKEIIKFVPFAAVSSSDAGRVGTVGWRDADRSLSINFGFSCTTTVSFLVFYI